MTTDNSYGDGLVKCKICGKGFLLSPEKREWYRERNLSLPQRCPACILAAKREGHDYDHPLRGLKRLPR